MKINDIIKETSKNNESISSSELEMKDFLSDVDKINEVVNKIVNLPEEKRKQVMEMLTDTMDIEYGPGTKGDRYTKYMIKKILREGKWDLNPRTRWRDVYSNAKYYEYANKVLTEDGEVISITDKMSVELDGENVIIYQPAYTLSLNHVIFTYDLNKGETPLITLRNIAIKSSIAELKWIYFDASNDLVDFDELLNQNTWDVDHVIHNWWNQWPIRDKDGNLILNEKGHPIIGDCYGGTIGSHGKVGDTDIKQMYDALIFGLKKEPDGRRHIICMWQVDDFENPHGLKPCAFMTVWNVRHEEDGDYLDMCLFQRSSDFITAGCINQFQYVILQECVARELGYKVGKFSWMVDNIQIYDRHIRIAQELLEREPVECSPKIIFDTEETDSHKLKVDDIKLVGYDRPKIKSKNPNFNIPVAI